HRRHREVGHDLGQVPGPELARAPRAVAEFRKPDLGLHVLQDTLRAMADYGPETYGDRWADAYDEFVASARPDTEETLEFLAQLAGDGPVLELGIGTGRIALPLRARGVDVHGIDASERMVAKLREKPGGAEIPVTIGD